MFKFMSILAMTVAASAAQAALISGAGSLPDANPINIPSVDYMGNGPQVFGPITWTSEVTTSQFGWTGGADFGSNGSWASGDPILALNAGFNPVTGGYGSMTLTFDNPVSGFLAEVNWRLGVSNLTSVIIRAYDANGNLLTHPEFPPSSDFHYYWFLANNGQFNVKQPGFYGFTFANPVIKRVVFSNGFIAVRNMSWTGPAVGGSTGVPEPATWAMLIAGFGIAGIAVRRHRAAGLTSRAG